MLKINATDLISNYLARYNTWCAAKTFYKEYHPPLAINDPLGCPSFHFTNVEAINSCNSNVVAIDCLTEGLHAQHHFKKYLPNKHYIIFSNGWWDTTKISFGIDYTLVWNLYFLFEIADTWNSPYRFSFHLDKTYNYTYPKPNIFTSTIGNVRSERTYFVDFLLKNITYKNFILRYSGENFGVDADKFDVVSFVKGEFDPYNSIATLEEYYHNVSQTIPIDMYNQAYFNLVVETDIDYNDDFFLTEKTIKALLTGIPFVICSTPNFLKWLKKLGFLTYDSLWDESYDEEPDYKTRIKMISKLCNDLEQFDWVANQSKLEDIARKNKVNFLNLNNIADIEFQDFETQISKFL